MPDSTMDADSIRDAVRLNYAARAREVLDGGAGCGCGAGGKDPITGDLYAGREVEALPPDAVRASLGCGNPTALIDLRPGETVLDLGSGGGIDVLLSARRVGPGGFAFGLDMTDEMLALAERNRVAAGATNVRFLRGTIEAVPLADASVDVVISNCVINLSADKARVLREANRVLRAGGRFAVSDIVFRGAVPEGLRASMESWSGCVAGALGMEEYRRLLAEAGFVDIDIQVTREYGTEDGSPSTSGCCGSSPGAGSCSTGTAGDPAVAGAGGLVSAFVRARKP